MSKRKGPKPVKTMITDFFTATITGPNTVQVDVNIIQQPQHNSHNSPQTKRSNKNYNTSHHSSPSKHTQPKQYHHVNQSKHNYSNSSRSPSSNSSSSDDDNHYIHRKPYPLPCKSAKRWQKIMIQLTKPIKDSTDLIKVLYQLAGDKHKSKLSCRGISALLNKVMTRNERQQFYQTTLPFIKQCATNLPSLFPNREISLLHEGCGDTIEFTEQQVASLLAMSFFGLNTWERGRDFPHFNITHLFGYDDAVYMEKLKCILHYFYISAMESKSAKSKTKTRTISIYRHVPNKHDYGQFQKEFLCKNVTPLCPFEFKVSGSIEECNNTLQIDFANKYIGGGVLGRGCVQEEIRFLINPECLVSLLLCQSMKPNEAIAIVGTRQFAKYKGYAASFEFGGYHNDHTPYRNYDRYYKLRNCIVAIDAERFVRNETWKQYSETKMKRELIKCYAGFSIPTADTNLNESIEMNKKLSIATGNWGCGVFGGDIELKCVIQWMGASLANRKIKYFAFGDKGCKYMASFTQIVQNNKLTVGAMWNYLCDYARFRDNAYRHNPNKIVSVFQYIVAQIRGKDKSIKLSTHASFQNKNNNDMHHKQWTQEQKENVVRNKYYSDKDQQIPRQKSFDDNELDIPEEDQSSSSCGLDADDEDDKKDKKKELKQISEKQDSNDNDEEDEDGDYEMVE